MAIAIEIRRTSQPPTSRKRRAERAANKNVIIQIPDRGLMRAGLLNHIVRVAVAIKVGYDSPASERRCWRRCGHIYQVVADDIEVDPFRRCRGDIGILASTNERILHVRMCLWTGLAQPITQIAAGVLIEIDNVIDTTVDGKIARAGRSNISDASRRPTEQVLGAKIVAVAVQMRSKTNDLIHFMLNRTLCVPAATAGRPGELEGLRGI